MGFKKIIVTLAILFFFAYVIAVLYLMSQGMNEPEHLTKAVTWFLTGELSLTALLAIFEKEDDKSENASSKSNQNEPTPEDNFGVSTTKNKPSDW